MTKTRTESAGEKDAKTTNTAENNEQRGERRWEQRIRRREDKNNTAVNLEEQHERWRFCIYGSLAISIWEHTGTYMNELICGNPFQKCILAKILLFKVLKSAPKTLVSICHIINTMYPTNIQTKNHLSIAVKWKKWVMWASSKQNSLQPTKANSWPTKAITYLGYMNESYKVLRNVWLDSCKRIKILFPYCPLEEVS
jgi:hypothetical protein